MPAGQPSGRYREKGVPAAILEYTARHDLHLATYAGAEAQAAAIADDIAYDAHDIDDGLRAGLLTLESLAEIDLIRTILAGIADEYPGLANDRKQHELVRRLITAMIEDVITEASDASMSSSPPRRRIFARRAGPVIAFSAEWRPRIARSRTGSGGMCIGTHGFAT